MTPSDHAANDKGWRRLSRRERQREELMLDWYGEDDGPREIEAHQAPSEQLGQVLNRVFHDLNMDDKVLLRKIIDNWPQLVGAEIACHTAPEIIQRDTLLVAISDASWRFRLQSQLRYLGQKLAEFTDGEVRSVKLVTGGRSATSRI